MFDTRGSTTEHVLAPPNACIAAAHFSENHKLLVVVVWVSLSQALIDPVEPTNGTARYLRIELLELSPLGG